MLIEPLQPGDRGGAVCLRQRRKGRLELRTTAKCRHDVAKVNDRAHDREGGEELGALVPPAGSQDLLEGPALTDGVTGDEFDCVADRPVRVDDGQVLVVEPTAARRAHHAASFPPPPATALRQRRRAIAT